MHAIHLFPLPARVSLPRRTMTVSALAATLLLSGCALPTYQQVRMADDEAPVMQGPGPRHNGTPLDSSFACLSHRIVEQGKGRAPLTARLAWPQCLTTPLRRGDAAGTVRADSRLSTCVYRKKNLTITGFAS